MTIRRKRAEVNGVWSSWERDFSVLVTARSHSCWAERVNLDQDGSFTLLGGSRWSQKMLEHRKLITRIKNVLNNTERS